MVNYYLNKTTLNIETLARNFFKPKKISDALLSFSYFQQSLIHQ